MKYVTKRLEWVDDILRDASKKLKELCRGLNHSENHGCKDIRQQVESAQTILAEIQDAAKEEAAIRLEEQDWRDEKLWKK
ncbi:MAG: hypothetical protein EBZ49_05105 [Proteobacteria bacterium]|nr:hypothetical protein [Pseudomonadota bacterium]